MGDFLTKGTTYADGGIVNAANLNAHVDDAVFKPTAISARADVGVPGGAAEFIVNDAGTLKKATMTNVAAAVVGSSLIHGKTEITALTALDELLVWEDGVAADRRITIANAVGTGQLTPVGGVIQTLVDDNVASLNITSAIPIDDTVPLITEGEEILSQAITPKSTSNTVLVRAQCYAASSNIDEIVAFAVFRGTTCIQAEAIQASNGTNPTMKFALEIRDAPATASAVTYSVRMGITSGATLRINGFSNGRKFGGESAATLVLQELKG